MKRIFASIFLVLVFASLAFAQGGMGPGPGVKGYAAAGCTTANDGLLSTDAQSYGNADNGNLGIADTTKKKAGKFSLAAQSTVTEYIVRWLKVGAADAFTGYCSIYTHDPVDDAPETEVADTGVTISSAVLTEDVYVDEIMTLGTPKTGMAADTYWLVCKLSARTSGTGSVSLDNAGLTGARFAASDDGTTWTDTANQTMRHKVNGCAE